MKDVTLQNENAFIDDMSALQQLPSESFEQVILLDLGPD